jgi:hypothetical protein
MAEQEQAIRVVLSEEIKHVPLDETLIREDGRPEKDNGDESLFKDLMDGVPRSPNQLIRIRIVPPSEEIDKNGVEPIPEIVTSTYDCAMPTKTLKQNSRCFPHFTDSNDREPEHNPETNSIQKIAEESDGVEKPQRLDAEITNETIHQPKFYSEITNVKGRRFLVASFRESMQKLEDENNELRLKMLNSALEELRR